MIQRFILLAAVAVGSPLRAEVSDTIKPGVELAAADATLEKFGYHIDEKFHLDVAPRDANHGLAISQIDDGTTLILGYRVSTKEVDSTGVIIIPERRPKLQRAQFYLTALEIKFEMGGVYSLKLKRGQATDGVTKSASISSGSGQGHTQ